MKWSKLLTIICLVMIAFGLALLATPKAEAADKAVTSFTGFAFEKSTLNLGMKKQIKSWFEQNPGYQMVSCTGYTGFNVKNRDKAFLQKLALDRAKAICDYIRTLAVDTIAIHSTKGVPGDGKTASARKVTVTLFKVDDGGGSGVVTVGVCDTSLKATMRSKIFQGDFSFAQIRFSDISTGCNGNVMDVYLLNQNGDQLASAVSVPITKTSVTILNTSFAPTQISSKEIFQIAIEIRKN